ncbi:MAG TPA: rhomboid family intramembrane serine protease [Gemmatimonadaceae bacterium]|nr:rhomboid family intramembrane serine protease [Gemmatimonadaceae bacterium]
MPQPIADDVPTPRLTPAVGWLIASSVAIWYLQFLFADVGTVAALLGFEAHELPRRWWSVVTYTLVHGSLWYLALNMYALLLFGPRLERAWSAGELARLWAVCALGGLAVQLLFFRDRPLVGSSAAVFGIMLAYARRWPDDEVHLFSVMPIRVRWLVALLAVMMLVGAFGAHDGVGVAHLAHVGGFLAGWAYLRVQEAAGGRSLRPRVDVLPDDPDETPRAVPRGLPRIRERSDETDEIVAKSKAAIANRAAPPPVSRAAPTSRPPTELDGILDKIARQGMASLTAAERRLLEEESRKRRDG